LNDAEKYLFDARGYLVLKNCIEKSVINDVLGVIKELENTDEADFPAGVTYGKPRSDEEAYISSVICASEKFKPIVFSPKILEIMRTVTLGMVRLNHAYSISRFAPGGYTYMHMGGSPIHPKGAYLSNNGEIFSITTKAVVPLSHNQIEDGCFAIIPGSHKSSFKRPFDNHPDNNEGLVPIDAEAGDIIIFTEACAHGSLVKKSENIRRTLFLCFSVAYMPDWTKLNLVFSDEYLSTLNSEERKLFNLKVD
jgi:hypothetical protein